MFTAENTPLSGEERIKLLEQLAREHQRLRSRVVELTALAEAAVARAVLAEKRIRHLDDVIADKQAHIDALMNSRTMRLAAPARRVYAKLRDRRVGR
jgi:hypothetical protein